MKDEKVILRAFKRAPFGDIAIYIQSENFQTRKLSFVKVEDMQFTEHPEGCIIDPTIGIDPIEAQRLIDDLWDAGLRPSEGSGSAGSLKATQEHLADMRKIAFNKLKIEKEI